MHTLHVLYIGHGIYPIHFLFVSPQFHNDRKTQLTHKHWEESRLCQCPVKTFIKFLPSSSKFNLFKQPET